MYIYIYIWFLRFDSIILDFPFSVNIILVFFYILIHITLFLLNKLNFSYNINLTVKNIK